MESSRFPGKATALVGGVPLVRAVYERLRTASTVSEVVVATDSDEVEAVLKSTGGRVVRVDGPCATGSDRVAAAAAGTRADVVVNLQCDQPAIDPTDIDRTVEALLESGTDIATLAYAADDPEGLESADVVKVTVDERGLAAAFSRTPIDPFAGVRGPADSPLYLHHVGIYCFRREALERFAGLPQGVLEKSESLEQLRALENGMTIAVVMTERQTVSVSRPEDLALVEAFIGSS